MNIPMNAKVTCTDGEYGRSTRVILDPKNKKVTHIVVREKARPHIERVIPIEQVTETTPLEIRLACTARKAREMETFVAVEYLQAGVPKFHHTELKILPHEPSTHYRPPKEQFIKIEHERIPQGELALQKGVRVKAKDGHIGHVHEFLVDPKDGHITNLVLREGHLWGQKDVVVSVSEVERIEDKTVYSKLEKSFYRQFTI